MLWVLLQPSVAQCVIESRAAVPFLISWRLPSDLLFSNGLQVQLCTSQHSLCTAKAACRARFTATRECQEFTSCSSSRTAPRLAFNKRVKFAATAAAASAEGAAASLALFPVARAANCCRLGRLRAGLVLVTPGVRPDVDRAVTVPGAGGSGAPAAAGSVAGAAATACDCAPGGVAAAGTEPLAATFPAAGFISCKP